MRWYVSKTNNKLNRRLFRPESITPYLCVNPKYPVEVARSDALVLLDSGAFQDVAKDTRLTPAQALKRQLDCERRCGFVAEKIVSYDRLIDEQLDENGKQVKRRWDVAHADDAVEETVLAAKFLASVRSDLAPRRLVLSCQGVTVDQYVGCAKRILDEIDPSDVFGYGGFCIIGQRRHSISADGITYPAQFIRTVEQTAPLLAEAGVKDAHVFGVLLLDALREATAILRRYGIELSTDSSSVERNSVIEGKVWNGDAGFRGNGKLGREWKWTGAEGDPPPGYWHPNILAHENIARAVKTLEAI